MADLQVRLPKHVSRHLLEELWHFGEREPVLFGFANHAQVRSKDLVLIRDVVTPPKGAFLPSQGHGARWTGAYMIELLNRALERRQGLFIFHSHPANTEVHMSSDDRASAGDLLPKFQMLIPGRPHGSVVIGLNSVAGMVLMPSSDMANETFSLRLLDDHVVTWPLPTSTHKERILYDRQPIAANRLAKEILRHAKVAVVGLSGGGSQVVRQLARLGVGEIIGIDDQRVEQSNIFATDAVGWLDVLLRRKKTSIMKSTTWWINNKVKFRPIASRVPEKPALQELKRADIIVGCVNNLQGRADLMEVAWRYCIPYVDIGMAIKTAEEAGPNQSPLTAIPGNVFTAIPGGPCMWCTGFLSRDKLDAETGGRGRAYLQDVTERDAYVLSFNATLAGQAVSEVLQLLLGYAPSNSRVPYRRYDGFTGELREWEVSRSPECEVCSNVLAAGDPLWT